MSAETDLYAALSGASGVTALVSSRIYPDMAPQEAALPCVAYTRSGTEYATTIHSGVPSAERATLEVWCMALTRTAADALALQVLAAAGAAGFLVIERVSIEPTAEQTVLATVLTFARWYT